MTKLISYTGICGRQSGRTTRMLIEAIQRATNGYKVWVVGTNNEGNLYDFRSKLADLSVGLSFKHPIIIVDYTTLQRERGVDWEKMQPYVKNDPEELFFFDHTVIAEKFRNIIDQYHRYDINVPVHQSTLKENGYSYENG